jgi:RHS repeat-associated protein
MTAKHRYLSRSPAAGGLDYFGARYYSSTLGRWMTPDWSAEPIPVPYAKLTNPQSLNLYSYVMDDPLSHTDIDGHFQSAPANTSCPNNNGDACKPQVSIIQIQQTVNLYEDAKDPTRVTGTVQVNTTIQVVYGGGMQTSMTAISTAANVGNTHYTNGQLATIANTVSAVQIGSVGKALGSDPARLLTAVAGRESTFGLTSRNNPLQLSCSSGICASRTDRAMNIDHAEDILAQRVRRTNDDPARTYHTYNMGPDVQTNTVRFMGSYANMQQSLNGATYTGPTLTIPDGLK